MGHATTMLKRHAATYFSITPMYLYDDSANNQEDPSYFHEGAQKWWSTAIGVVDLSLVWLAWVA